MGMATTYVPPRKRGDPQEFHINYVDDEETFEHELNPGFRRIGGGEHVSPLMCWEPVHDMASGFEENIFGKFEAVVR